MANPDSTPWEELYQQGDTGWDRGEPSPALKHWLDHGMNRTQHVLIPGCGRGHEVLALAKQGFQVTALDMAPSAIEALQQALRQAGVSANLICGDLFQYDAPESVDAVYEQTCLCALPPQQRQAYADKLYQWLKPGGYLYFSMMQTGEAGGPPYHCDWLDMRQLFSSERWQWPTTPPVLIPRPKGMRYELAFALQKHTKD